MGLVHDCTRRPAYSFSGLKIPGLLFESSNCRVQTDIEKVHGMPLIFLHSIVFFIPRIWNFVNHHLYAIYESIDPDSIIQVTILLRTLDLGLKLFSVIR